MKQLEVRLVREPGRERAVGWLVEPEPGGPVYFEYDPDFLRRPLWLSPFKLPPQAGLIEHRDRAFGPLFGLFDDSLPDGWGLMLMDRYFRQQGLVPAGVSVLDRLSYLGTRTMGALTYHPPSEPARRDPRVVDLHELARASERVLEGSAEEVLPQLLRAGGSPGGARPKVLVGVGEDGASILSGEDVLPPGYEHWIVKFHSRREEPDAGAVELAYSRMARDAGIVMPPTRLFATADGDRFFGVRRFDRRGERRFHIHTFGNLIHADFRLPSCDYQQLLEVTRVLTRDHRDVVEAFRRAVFNVLAHNRDDHVKNFAFRLNDEDEWELAPAYDLVHGPGPGGEHTTSIAGEGRAPGRAHLLRLAEPAGISEREAERVIDEVAAATARWRDHARRAEVGPRTAGAVEKAIAECLRRL